MVQESTNLIRNRFFRKSIIIGICSAVFLFILDNMIMVIRQKSDDFPYIKYVLVMPLWESIMQFIDSTQFELAKVITIPLSILFIIIVGATYGFIIALIMHYSTMKLKH